MMRDQLSVLQPTGSRPSQRTDLADPLNGPDWAGQERVIRILAWLFSHGETRALPPTRQRIRRLQTRSPFLMR
jgi:hypothetical protein